MQTLMKTSAFFKYCYLTLNKVTFEVKGAVSPFFFPISPPIF